uniref:Uncharacterized protein n=1 Tax=Oryza brachyantha TaxID=4533 RepID=J3M182_ORYBR
MASKAGTSQGMRSTPSCWNPNSSSASRSSAAKARCLRYSVGITNRCIDGPTHTARCPLAPPPPPPLPPAPAAASFGATESLRHFLSICCSRTISVILFDFLP